MCVHMSVTNDTNCSSDYTSEPSTPEGNFNFSDGKSYDVEVDIRAGCHIIMSQNNTYDNFDYNKHFFPNEIWIQKADWEIGVKTAASIAVVILGIVGNVLLLSAVLRNRSMRTPTNLLIANMAVADLATLIILPWVFICMDCFQNYILGEVGCKAQGFLECSLLFTGVLNLVAVSYDRLTAIVTPLEARMTVHGAHIVMAFTWVTGVILGLPLVFFRIYRERKWKNFNETYCTEERAVMSVYWYVVILFVVWLPLILMILCYSALFFKLDRYERKVLRREHPISVSYKTKVARTLFVVVVVFVLCRVPFTALIFLRADLHEGTQTINQVVDAYNTLWFVSHYLIIVNAATDPIIYGLTNENFRRAFRTSALARWLFGTSVAEPVLRTPRPPMDRLEPRNLFLKSASANHWFSSPGQMKS
ncbi:neuropeptide Y receptor type 1 [Zootermopsis nevadensis]|uniref:neuropeptide Y receptor type 1 n=1 Tax=Zootermopsis nevadensis TaxID=136037 RepID=UPI000B8EAA8D|nr:neuropeptide Y receptor type 1 [Zootermopsis nevadensis]